MKYRTYPYRWVVLGVFMLTNLTIQILWISYAPVTSISAAFYNVSDIRIGLLSMSFMIAFIPFSIPSSMAIDNWGLKKSVGLGAVVMSIFAVIRGFAGQNYTTVLISTFGIAAAQPLLLNSWTTVAAKWFADNQKATAVGLITLANLTGTAIGMVLTPLLLEKGICINKIQLYYGFLAVISAVLFLLLAKDKPVQPPSENADKTRALMMEGLKNAFGSIKFRYTLAVAFAGLGIFNGISTWIENIIKPRGFSPTDAGITGAVMLLGGLTGAVIIPFFSDKEQKRQKYLYISIAGAIPGVLGLAFAPSYLFLILSAFILGFFLVSALPVAMQYAAEVTFPTPEGTSNGLIQLFGQGAVVFVYIMSAVKTKNGSFTPAMLLSVLLLAASLFFVSRMKDKEN